MLLSYIYIYIANKILQHSEMGSVSHDVRSLGGCGCSFGMDNRITRREQGFQCRSSLFQCGSNRVFSDSLSTNPSRRREREIRTPRKGTPVITSQNACQPFSLKRNNRKNMMPKGPMVTCGWFPRRPERTLVGSPQVDLPIYYCSLFLFIFWFPGR